LLLHQSFEVIQDRAKLERERRSQLSDILAYAARKRDLALMAKAFSHWDESTLHRKRVTSLAQMHALKVKYFAQWRRIAAENAAKVKFILGRKYVAIWRERVLRNRLALEQADAHFEESLMKRCFSRWFWSFCDRQAEGWHELQLMRHTLTAWRARIETVRQETAQAQQFRERRLTAAALRKVVQLYGQRRRQVREVDQVRQRSVAVTCLQALQNEAKLRPVARTTVEMVAVSLKNKAFRVWSLHLQLTRQAAEVDRRRILQTAWTNWNDALRSKALAQRIDGRVLAESLYKWILQYRLRTLQKEKNAYLARAALLRWRQQTEQANLTLEDAETLFAARQRTRLLRFGMTRLHSALRVREDGHRAAIEFANGRAVPRVVHAWRARLEHLQRLDKWAVDARFYCLGTQTLSVWRDKATKHHNQRLREAYRQLRAHVKIRQARACLSLWRERSNHLENLQITANDHLQSQIQKIATSSIRSMQTRTLQHRDLDAQAVALDRTKLLASALSAMQLSYANVSEMSAQAILFRQESDVVLVVNTWKKLQWRAFTTARQRETAEAFRIRTREQRIRAMMRYWAGKTISRRAKRHFEEQREITTESPSLRPASRRAAVASLQGRLANVTAAAEEYPSFLEIGPSPFEEDLSRTFLNATVTTLPAYLRTPSRSSRRSTRFHSQYQNLYQRPVLPTPAHATPLVFDPGAFLGTSTPAYPPPTMPIVMPVRLKEMTTEPNANVNINESTTKASAPKTSTKTAASTSATTSPRAPLEKDASQGTPVRPTAKRAPSSTASTPQITPFSRKLRAGGVAMPLSSARPRLSAVGRSPIAERVSASPSAPGKGKASRINGTSNNSADHGSANEDRDEGDRDDDNNGDTPGRHSAGNDSNNENNNGNQVLGRSVLGTGKSVRFAAPTSASLSRARKSRFR
jgi:protein SFI1